MIMQAHAPRPAGIRGLLLRVWPNAWVDVLLDTGELLVRYYHIRELDIEPDEVGGA